MNGTIVAVASAAGAARRAVVRLSGPRAAAIVQACCTSADGDPLGAPLEQRARALLDVVLEDGVGPQPAQLLWMPGPRSFTAEDVAELHLAGQPDLVEAALARLLSLGARSAEPGEFTRRAFENGRIDLTQAEGVAALVSARNAAEQRAAMALLVGGLSRRIDRVREALEEARSLAEASLDFDEADTGHVPFDSIEALVLRGRERLEDALGWEVQRARASAAPTVALAGVPNAGKSTLFNGLSAGELVDAAGPALVSDLAGTTRDSKRGTWSIGADGARQQVILVDTAGRDAGQTGPGAAGGDEPAAIADSRALDQVRSADLVLWLVAAGAVSPGARPEGADPQRTLLVWSQVDALASDSIDSGPPAELAAQAAAWVAVSARTGAGLAELEAVVLRKLGGDGSDGGQGRTEGAVIGARHREALRAALEAVGNALGGARAGLSLDLIAQDLRTSTDELDAIVGRTTPEDLLDRIFATFCLGK